LRSSWYLVISLGRCAIEVQGSQPYPLFIHGAAAAEVAVVFVDPRKRVRLAIVVGEAQLRPMGAPPVVVVTVVAIEGAAAAAATPVAAAAASASAPAAAESSVFGSSGLCSTLSSTFCFSRRDRRRSWVSKRLTWW